MQPHREPARPWWRQGWAWRALWLVAALALYLVATTHQLGLPGLHYDEAREAGQNAMELLTGAPVMAFRGAAITVLGVRLPLMVQDYIGALNVYLALPLLAISGIGVPNLRVLGVLTGLAALLLLERAVSAWLVGARTRAPKRVPLTTGGLVAVTLAAASPSFVFWSRQGIFVTNLAQPFVLLSIWQGVRWWQGRGRRALWWAALGAGLALYAKLLAIWVVAPLALLLGGAWLWRRAHGAAPRLGLVDLAGAALAFALPLLPLLIFNVQTRGTLAAVGGNLGVSYYGVNNRAVWANLAVRLPQLAQVLAGDQFWYLGAIYANAAAPWIAGLLAAAGLGVAWRRLLPPLLLVALALATSLFTVSDLFITHYALLLPLLVGLAGVGAGALLEWAAAHTARPARWRGAVQAALVLLVALWAVGGVGATRRYHAALARSGGLADHSDASYDLAYALRYGGMGAPIALDWGMDATVRFLSEGAVTPIEIFGYASPAAPDAGFAARLAPFLADAHNVYLLRAPGQEVFKGRREVFVQAAAASHLRLEQVATFAQRDGTPLYEIWRAVGE